MAQKNWDAFKKPPKQGAVPKVPDEKAEKIMGNMKKLINKDVVNLKF